MHYLHAASIVLAILLPLPSGLVFLKDGFVTLEHPTFICFGRNTEYTYYALILPASILLGMATILLVISFWILFKVLVLTLPESSYSVRYRPI